MFIKLSKVLLMVFVCMATFFGLILPCMMDNKDPIVSILGYSASVGIIYCMSLRIAKIMESK